MDILTPQPAAGSTNTQGATRVVDPLLNSDGVVYPPTRTQSADVDLQLLGVRVRRSGDGVVLLLRWRDIAQLLGQGYCVAFFFLRSGRQVGGLSHCMEVVVVVMTGL